VAKLDAHPCFERMEVGADDPFVHAIREETEEGKKVSRQGGHMTDGSKYHCVSARRAPGDGASNPRLWGDDP